MSGLALDGALARRPSEELEDLLQQIYADDHPVRPRLPR